MTMSDMKDQEEDNSKEISGKKRRLIEKAYLSLSHALTYFSLTLSSSVNEDSFSAFF